MGLKLRNNTIYRYYGQYGEDYILWNFFDYKENGFFIDVGAFDGIHLSNSYSFEQQGWKGICIEPVPFYFNLCKKNRPNSICIDAACTSIDNLNELEIETDETGLFSSTTLLKDAESIKGHYSLIQREILTKKIKVTGTTLNTILSNNFNPELAAIDFISIDVEGSELDVLKGFDLIKFSPHVILIETNTPESTALIGEYLSGYGYLFARKEHSNSYFVKSQTDVEKINSIELTCTIEKQIHPLGVNYTIKEYYNGIFFWKGKNSANQLKEYSHEIKKFSYELTKKENQLSKKENQLNEKVILINDIYNSNTYKIGAIILFPLKKIKKFVNYILKNKKKKN